ncbi:Methionine aminopeptidase 1D, mitochondrial [Kappamyces sp. JEL0829]|nr:Methionine aminopeptidase 1D, mitochondrial [Kappamyces sp. JEL0829]
MKKLKFGNYPVLLPRPSQAWLSNVSLSELAIPVYAWDALGIKAAAPKNTKLSWDLDALKRSCLLAKNVLDWGCRLIKPGLTTRQLNDLIHQEITRHGAYPSPLFYHGFPASVCTSINNVLCHGIPDDRPFDSRDIVNLDITVYLNGWHGDTSRTVPLSDQVDAQGMELISACQEALARAISVCGPGVPFSRIGTTIEEFASSKGFRVDPYFCGHGIGREFHTDPTILHYANTEPGVMKEGMVFTIEPILLQGRPGYRKWPDGWTAVSRDGGRSAQFEHTVLITDAGVQILT